MKGKIKPDVQWVIVGPRGIFYRTNSFRKQDAINDFVGSHPLTWKKCREKLGYRAVKVRMEEVK